MRTACITLAMVGWLALAAQARGDAQSVRSALTELDQWLALSPRAAGWHDYLRTRPLGIATRPPEWVGSPAFAMRFHRTAVDRIAKEGLAGTTLAGTRLGAAINNVVGLLLLPAASEEVKDDWSVTFRQDRPLTLELLADGFAMTLRGSSFFAGGDRYQGVDVRANYRFENTERGPRFVRRALELRSPEAAAPLPGGDNAAGPARKVAADVIAGWFNRVFIDELGGVGPMLRGSQGLRLGPLAQFSVADDWVTIGWEPAPKAPGETGNRGGSGRRLKPRLQLANPDVAEADRVSVVLDVQRQFFRMR